MMQKIEEAEVLQENYIVPESMYDGLFSKTSQFMTPAIGVNVTNKLVFKYFLNAFLTDVEHKHEYVRPIFVLFGIDSFKSNDWKRVYQALIKSSNLITEYDVGRQNDKFLLMMVFSVPEEFKEDYVNFRLGRYSLFSDKYKEKFPKYLNSKTKKKNIHWQIINKDERLKRNVEEEFNMSFGELDRPTIINGETFPPASEIWGRPERKREYYRYCDSLSL